MLFGEGDPSTHLGLVSEIISNGYSIDNHYPVIHIYVSEISISTNISPLILFKYIRSFLHCYP